MRILYVENYGFYWKAYTYVNKVRSHVRNFHRASNSPQLIRELANDRGYVDIYFTF